jgi:CheY-like chemotaxis protein
MTAQAMTGDEAEARLAGFDAYVTNPIDTRTLPRLVTRLLGPQQWR